MDTGATSSSVPPPADPEEDTQTGFPYRLAFGIRWFGSGNVPLGTDASPKPGAPCVLYVHGYERTTTGRGVRESFCWEEMDPPFGLPGKTCDAWIEEGWNVGIFYWNQFADEDKLTDCEAKIWTARGPQGMRWRRRLRLRAVEGESGPRDEAPSLGPVGSFLFVLRHLFDPLGRANLYTRFEEPGPGVPAGASAADLFFRAYVQAFAGAAGEGAEGQERVQEVRVVGHSLGAQMALRLADLLLAARAAGTLPPRTPLPARVALLDPFFTCGRRDWLGGRSTADAAADAAARAAAAGIAIEQVHTSGVPDLPFVAERSERLRAVAAFLGQREAGPAFISAWNLRSRHLAAPHLYFRSFSDPSSACGIARWPHSRIRALMSSRPAGEGGGGQVAQEPLPKPDTLSLAPAAGSPYQS
eukprot:tig00000444_g802.t1